MLSSHLTLNRQDHLRKDPEALRKLWQQASTRLLPVCGGRCLVTADASDPKLAWLRVCAEWDFEHAIFIGTTDDTAWFALNITEPDIDQLSAQALSYPSGSSASEAFVHQGESSVAYFADLRVVRTQLSGDEIALLAVAKGLSYWHGRTNFCNLCGTGLNNSHGGHVKQCSNSDCKELVFPRTDPAVIMLVTRVDEAGVEHCLLGRNAKWPTGMYSTLAGFVESGESLEHAVIREVFEESGVHVEDVRYLASQPWPFPRSIMLGFIARATTHQITLDENELEDAQWFSREQLRSFGPWGDSDFSYQLPRRDSIASYLINQWMETEGLSQG